MIAFSSAALSALLAVSASSGKPFITGRVSFSAFRFEPTSETGFAFESAGASFKTMIAPDSIEMRFPSVTGEPSAERLRGEWRRERDQAYRTVSTEDIVRVEFVGRDLGVELVGEDPLPGKSNYYRGSDPAKWRVGVPHYAQIRYRALYPGIDLIAWKRLAICVRTTSIRR